MFCVNALDTRPFFVRALDPVRLLCMLRRTRFCACVYTEQSNWCICCILCVHKNTRAKRVCTLSSRYAHSLVYVGLLVCGYTVFSLCTYTSEHIRCYLHTSIFILCVHSHWSIFYTSFAVCVRTFTRFARVCVACWQFHRKFRNRSNGPCRF